MAAAATTFSQLSSFASISRNLHLRQRRSIHFLPIRPKLSVVMSLQGHDPEASSSSNMPKLSYQADLPTSTVEVTEKTYTQGNVNGKLGVNGPLDPTISEKKKGAKIHDFCFGIPFGGFVLTGGVLGSILSRNLATLGTGVLFGGAVLAFSITSLKVWREGKSSFPFIIGQADKEIVSFWTLYFSECRHAAFLLICGHFWRKSTTQKIGTYCTSCIVTRLSKATKELRAMGVKSLIFGITASNSKSDIEAFIEAGLDEYIEKPLCNWKLDRMLKRVL